MEKSLPFYGGQALVEGVMMRGREVCTMAVRTPEKNIVVESQPLSNIYRSRIAKIPFLRGLLLLGDALVLGMRGLTYSVNMQAGEDEKVEGFSMVLTLIFSLTIGIAFFFLLPTGVGYLFEKTLGLSGIFISLAEGLARLILLIGYIWVIGFMPEIQRVYGYHGAEHKTINAYEAGAVMDVENVARYSREHARCGTSFLLTVVFFSILIFSLLGPMPILPRMLSRILLIPILAMISYEYIRLTARFSNLVWVRKLLAPNLALQRLTTREPDNEMLEVAITAFKLMRAKETSEKESIP